jgi:hypothetical protein
MMEGDRREYYWAVGIKDALIEEVESHMEKHPLILCKA